jgi:ABC-type oligopeptide transport system substrate-binding subunit
MATSNIDDIIAGKKPITDLGVKAIDANTFEVTLSEPVPYFYKLLVHPSVSRYQNPPWKNLVKNGRSLPIS